MVPGGKHSQITFPPFLDECSLDTPWWLN